MGLYNITPRAVGCVYWLVVGGLSLPELLSDGFVGGLLARLPVALFGWVALCFIVYLDDGFGWGAE